MVTSMVVLVMDEAGNIALHYHLSTGRSNIFATSSGDRLMGCPSSLTCLKAVKICSLNWCSLSGPASPCATMSELMTAGTGSYTSLPQLYLCFSSAGKQCCYCILVIVSGLPCLNVQIMSAVLYAADMDSTVGLHTAPHRPARGSSQGSISGNDARGRATAVYADRRLDRHVNASACDTEQRGSATVDLRC